MMSRYTKKRQNKNVQLSALCKSLSCLSVYLCVVIRVVAWVRVKKEHLHLRDKIEWWYYIITKCLSNIIPIYKITQILLYKNPESKPVVKPRTNESRRGEKTVNKRQKPNENP